MIKRILLSIATALMSLCAMAQSEFYVVMKDGSAQSYPSDKVDSMTFKNPEVATIMGFGDMMKMIDALKSELDSLKRVLANGCSANDTTPVTPSVSNGKYVDLGLPSGTLWATYNVGAKSPEEYGDYFAWGETEPKEIYSKDSKWYGVPYDSLIAKGVIDKNGNLTGKYDAATANWGSDWRMPTSDEIEEQLTLDNEYVEVNGVNGRMFIGTNGNTLFLPFAGYRCGDELYGAGGRGYYWSATAIAHDRNAFYLGVDSGGAYWDYGHDLSLGFTVRPVLRTK